MMSEQDVQLTAFQDEDYRKSLEYRKPKDTILNTGGSSLV